MAEVIEHLVQGTMRALREVNRVLRHGGIAVLSTPNLAKFPNRFGLLFCRTVNWSLKSPYPYYDSDVFQKHNRDFTVSEIEFLLRQCNLASDIVPNSKDLTSILARKPDS